MISPALRQPKKAMLIAAAYRNRSCLRQLPLESTEQRSVLSNQGMIGFLILCLAVFWRPRSRDARWGVFFSGSSPPLFIYSALTADRYNLAVACWT